MSTELTTLMPLWLTQRRDHVASDAVYRTLREGIVTGVVAAGTRLGEVPLATELSISRTPVREALHRLETERFVRRSDRRGMVVAEVTADDILEVYVVRAAINGLASRLAADGAAPVDITRLRQINDEIIQADRGGDSARMASLNLEFHEFLCGASRNRLLMQLMRQVHDTVRRFPGTTLSVPGRAVQAIREHEALVDAIADHDGERAETIARAHITKAMEVRMAMLELAKNDLGA